MFHTYIIAEAGVNHNGSLLRAKQLIDMAKNAGADAVKFQTFQTELLIEKDAPKASYQEERIGKEETQYEMLKKLELSQTDFRELKAYAEKENITFLSTPDELASLHFLAQELDLPIIKISSGEINNALLLLQAARTKKKIILSTGMASLGEIEQSLAILAFGYLEDIKKPEISAFWQSYCTSQGQSILQQNVTLLHCTTEYPAPYEESNLKALHVLKEAFGLRVGLSDHTLEDIIPVAAVALGAEVIEKHFTLDQNLPGPDHKASLNPKQLSEMIRKIRITESALGSGRKIPSYSETKNKSIVRKSLIANRTIRQGELFSEENLTTKRPSAGISALYYWDYLQKRATRQYEKGEKIDL